MIGLLAMAAAGAAGAGAGAATPRRLACTVSPSRIDIAIPAALDPSIRSIAVVRGATWRTIVDDRHRLAPYRAGNRTLMLPRRTQKAIHYSGGRAQMVRAFPTPGAYRIVFADNLETEPENMTSMSCDVRLR